MAFSDGAREGLKVLIARVEELQRSLEDGSRRQLEREERLLQRIEGVERSERDHHKIIDRKVGELTTSLSGSPTPNQAPTGSPTLLLSEMDDLQETIMSDVRNIMKAFKSRQDSFKESTQTALEGLQESTQNTSRIVEKHILESTSKLRTLQHAAEESRRESRVKRRKDSRGSLSDLLLDDTAPISDRSDQDIATREDLRQLEARFDAKISAQSEAHAALLQAVSSSSSSSTTTPPPPISLHSTPLADMVRSIVSSALEDAKEEVKDPPKMKRQVSFPSTTYNSPVEQPLPPLTTQPVDRPLGLGGRKHSVTSVGSGCSVSSKVSAKIRLKVEEMEDRVEERMQSLMEQNKSLRREVDKLKIEIEEEIEGKADQILGATTMTLDRRLGEFTVQLEKEMKALKESTALCPTKGGSESYNTLKSLFDMRLFGEKVVSEWSKKKGSVLDELAENLVFPEGVDPNEALSMAAHRLQVTKGAAYPDRNSVELLVMALYTMAGPDIDCLVGFEDAPVYDDDTKQEWDRYAAHYRGKRNSAVFSVLNWASRTAIEAKGSAGEEAWVSLRKWMKFFGLLLAMASECRAAYPSKVYGKLKAQCGEGGVTRQVVRNFLRDNELFREKLGIYSNEWESGDADEAVTEEQFSTIVMKSEPFNSNKTVARGITGLPQQVLDTHRAMGEGSGAQLYWPSPSSCAFDTTVSESYIKGHASNANKDKGEAILFIIKDVSFGLNLQAISQYPREAELLLPPMTIFEVASVKPYRANNASAITMELKCRSALGSTTLSSFCADVLLDSSSADVIAVKRVKSYHRLVGDETLSDGSSTLSPLNATGSAHLTMRERMVQLEQQVAALGEGVGELTTQNSLLNAAVTEVKQQTKPAHARMRSMTASSSSSQLSEDGDAERVRRYSQQLLRPESKISSRPPSAFGSPLERGEFGSPSPAEGFDELRAAVASITSALGVPEGVPIIPAPTLLEQLDNSHTRLATAEADLSTMVAEVQRLTQSERRADTKLGVLSKAVSEIETRSQTVEFRREAERGDATTASRVGSVENDVLALTSEVRSAAAGEERARDRLTRIEDALREVQNHVVSATRLETQRRPYLDSAVRDFTEQRPDARLQSALLRVEGIERELQSVQPELRRVVTAIDTAETTQQITLLQADTTALSRRTADLESQHAEGKLRVDDIAREVTRLGSTVVSVSERVQGESADLPSRVASAEAKLGRLSSVVEEGAAQSSADVVKAKTHSERELAKLREAVEDIAADVDKAKRRLVAMEQQAGAATDDDTHEMRLALTKLDKRVAESLRLHDSHAEDEEARALQAATSSRASKELRERLTALEQQMEQPTERELGLVLKRIVALERGQEEDEPRVSERDLQSLSRRVGTIEQVVEDIQQPHSEREMASALKRIVALERGQEEDQPRVPERDLQSLSRRVGTIEQVVEDIQQPHSEREMASALKRIVALERGQEEDQPRVPERDLQSLSRRVGTIEQVVEDSLPHSEREMAAALKRIVALERGQQEDEPRTSERDILSLARRISVVERKEEPDSHEATLVTKRLSALERALQDCDAQLCTLVERDMPTIAKRCTTLERTTEATTTTYSDRHEHDMKRLSALERSIEAADTAPIARELASITKRLAPLENAAGEAASQGASLIAAIARITAAERSIEASTLRDNTAAKRLASCERSIRDVQEIFVSLDPSAPSPRNASPRAAHPGAEHIVPEDHAAAFSGCDRSFILQTRETRKRLADVEERIGASLTHAVHAETPRHVEESVLQHTRDIHRRLDAMEADLRRDILATQKQTHELTVLSGDGANTTEMVERLGAKMRAVEESLLREDRSKQSSEADLFDRSGAVTDKLSLLEDGITTATRVAEQKVAALEDFASNMHNRLVLLSEEHCTEWRSQACRIDRLEAAEKALEHAFIDHQHAVQGSLTELPVQELQDRVHATEEATSRMHTTLQNISGNVEKLVHIEVLTAESVQKVEKLTERVDSAEVGGVVRLQAAIEDAVNTANIAYSTADRMQSLNQADLKAITDTLDAIKQEKKAASLKVDSLSRALTKHAGRLDANCTAVVQLQHLAEDSKKHTKQLKRVLSQSSQSRSVSPQRDGSLGMTVAQVAQPESQGGYDHRLSKVESAIRKLRDGVHIAGEPACKYDYVLTELSKHRLSLERLDAEVAAVVMVRGRRDLDFPQRP